MGRSYEDLYCRGTDSYQIVTFGDSGSSAFHIPPTWLQFKKPFNYSSNFNE